MMASADYQPLSQRKLRELRALTTPTILDVTSPLQRLHLILSSFDEISPPPLGLSRFIHSLDNDQRP